MLTIDGSQGEGGGQVLRTALALALVTGAPFRMEKIRAGRPKSGLLRQHLTAVNAATAVGAAAVEGAELGSDSLVFRPGAVKAGTYDFAVGTAGSTGLVLQTVLPPLLTADGPSTLTVQGGTHNPFAPPYEFLARAFLPLVARMGPRVEMTLDRPGFYPAGGGQITVRVSPAPRLASVTLLERGQTTRHRARAVVANLSERIAHRELRIVREKLGWAADELEAVTFTATAGVRGPGNVLLLEIESEHVTEVFTGFGQVGVRAEAVAERAIQGARAYMAAQVPVGEYLADQLLIPFALAGGGAFRTRPLSGHSSTNIDVIGRFLGIEVAVTAEPGGAAVTVEVTARA